MIDYKKTATLFESLADPTRIRIAFELFGGPKYVGQIVEVIGKPIITVSNHLRIMVNCGILENERDIGDARRVVYRLRSDVFSSGSGRVIGTLKFGRIWVDVEKPPTRRKKS